MLHVCQYFPCIVGEKEGVMLDNTPRESQFLLSVQTVALLYTHQCFPCITGAMGAML